MKNPPLPFRGVTTLSLVAAMSCAPGAAPAPTAAPAAPTPEAAAPRIVRPGAPGEATRVVGADELNATRLPHTEADIRFMQGMIPHHAQALEMAALVKERTRSQDIRLLARRIAISQKDEIALMGRWLAKRNADVPGEHAHHMMGDHALMPGMLTAADMAQLAAARDADFDRLFLEFMIKHHEGAILMVRDLFASSGAAQETDIFTFASHVDADQQIEIQRMNRMLEAGR